MLFVETLSGASQIWWNLVENDQPVQTVQFCFGRTGSKTVAEPVRERFRNFSLPVWANGLDEGWFGEDYESTQPYFKLLTPTLQLLLEKWANAKKLGKL